MNQIEEVVRLRNRVGELEEENRFLRDCLTPGDGRFHSLGLRRAGRIILARLYDASPRLVTFESLIASISSERAEAPSRCLMTYLSRIRKSTRHLGVEIVTVRNVGYAMTVASKPVLKEVLQRETVQ